MEKNKSVNIFIVCSVLILIVLFSILYKVFDDDGCLLVKSTSEIDVDDKNPENESQIKEEDEKKARIENIKNNLKNSLPSANEYLLLNGSDKTIEEFVEWFAGKFGDEIILKLDNSNINEANRQQDLLSPKNESDGSAIEEIEIERKIYESTGETLLILLDEFMGIKDYDTMPCKEDGIHITFAGDICLAEDGFVLDYYDTVAGLSGPEYTSAVRKPGAAQSWQWIPGKTDGRSNHTEVNKNGQKQHRRPEIRISQPRRKPRRHIRGYKRRISRLGVQIRQGSYRRDLKARRRLGLVHRDHHVLFRQRDRC